MGTRNRRASRSRVVAAPALLLFIGATQAEVIALCLPGSAQTGQSVVASTTQGATHAAHEHGHQNDTPWSGPPDTGSAPGHESHDDCVLHCTAIGAVEAPCLPGVSDPGSPLDRAIAGHAFPERPAPRSIRRDHILPYPNAPPARI